MTLIIGFNCKDGSLVVSDRKISNLSFNQEKFECKLHSPIPNTALYFGSAGYSHLFKQFNRKIPLIVKQRLREKHYLNVKVAKELGVEYDVDLEEIKEEEPKEIQSSEKEIKKEDEKEKEELPEEPLHVYSNEDFIDDCSDLIYDLCKDKEGYPSYDLDVLLIMGSTDGAVRLHHIDEGGNEEEKDFCVIGSGAPHVREIINQFYSYDTNIEELLELAYFCIFYVQEMKLDRFVGVDKSELPDNRVILGGFDLENGNGLGTLSLKNKEGDIKKIKEKVKEFVKLKNSLKDVITKPT